MLCRGLPEQLQAQQEAAVEEEETGPPLGGKRQYLVVMRHGERMDEIDISWRATSKRPWDPPLSNKGLQQVGCGAFLHRKYMHRHGTASSVFTAANHQGDSPWVQASAAAEKLKGFTFGKVFISPFLRYYFRELVMLVAFTGRACSSHAQHTLPIIMVPAGQCRLRPTAVRAWGYPLRNGQSHVQ